jgi:hypothetical protein
VTDKYEECPLKTAGFKLETFLILPPMIIGSDGKCICTVKDQCLNVDKTNQQRCTLQELQKLDAEACNRRAWQSGDW